MNNCTRWTLATAAILIVGCSGHPPEDVVIGVDASDVPEATPSGITPVSFEPEKIAAVDKEIMGLFTEIHELEVARYEFEKYYEKEDGTSAWPEVLSELPTYAKTTPFEFNEYARSRRQFCDDLKERTEILRRQLAYLKDNLPEAHQKNQSRK